MNISALPFNIKDSISRVDKILDSRNEIIKVDGDFDISILKPHQTVDCKMACLTVTMHINKFDIDKNENLYKQYKCILSEVGSVINEINGAIEYSVLSKNTLSTLIRVTNEEKLDKTIDAAAKICSLLNILNKKFAEYSLGIISIGVGVSYNNARLTMEAFKEGIDSELLWYGNVVDESIKLSQNARTGFLGNSLMITKSVYERLSESYRNFFTYENTTDSFVSSLINKNLEAWSKDNM